MGEFFEKNKSLIVLFLAVVAVAIGIVTLMRIQKIGDSEQIVINTFDEDSSISQDNESSKKLLKVDIQGNVVRPGVYEFEEDQIIDDAIKKAGGLTDDADVDYIDKNLNRAEKLKDQQKIYIPAKGESKSNIDNSDNNDVLGENNEPGKVNINTASLEELDSLPGIGPSYAKKIIEGRPYSSIEDIKGVKGIGDSTFIKIQELITV